MAIKHQGLRSLEEHENSERSLSEREARSVNYYPYERQMYRQVKRNLFIARLKAAWSFALFTVEMALVTVGIIASLCVAGLLIYGFVWLIFAAFKG